MIKTPILIVGAGPTGLMLSAQLHRYGSDHVIADRKPDITKVSKALGVQARTLEQYAQLGIADAATRQGFIAAGMRFIVNGRVRAGLEFGEIGRGLSPFPYLFILEQSRNEALLRNKVTASGGEILWSTEVKDLRVQGKGYAGLLQRADGTSEPFECQYLVGCDGARSPVRQFLDMPFRGSTNEQLFFVADVSMEMELEKHGLLLVLNQKDFFAFFPMSGPGHYRAIGILPPTIVDPDDFSFDQLKFYIEGNLGFPARVVDHSWYSGYRVHHRITDSFRSGNAFLAGDAAHIHSPAGGQGMNTGLGDAVNLGWKLAAAVKGWSRPDILNSYNEERRPFGVRLVETTDRAFGLIVSKSKVARFLRTRLLPIILGTVLRFERLRRQMFKTISQTLIDYRKSALSDGSRSGSIKSGDRFPWFVWEDGNSFEWLQEPGYVVLCFGGSPAPDIAGWSGPVSTFDVKGAAARAAAGAGLPTTGIVEVRPDMHVSRIDKR
ncbi:MAG: FAD-dependent monooxygenase [Stappiaceae bacterium]